VSVSIFGHRGAGMTYSLLNLFVRYAVIKWFSDMPMSQIIKPDLSQFQFLDTPREATVYQGLIKRASRLVRPDKIIRFIECTIHLSQFKTIPSSTIYRKMKHSSKVRRLTLSIMGLFGANKPNVTRLNHKDEYYKNYYFPKNVCDGIEFIAKIERTSKKQAAELLMKAGLSSYMGDKLSKYIHGEHIAKEQNQKAKMPRFVLELRKLARERGRDISKFI